MRLMDTHHYDSAQRAHKGIRDTIAVDKRKLTIKEYCEFEKVPFEEIWEFLRGN